MRPEVRVSAEDSERGNILVTTCHLIQNGITIFSDA